MVNILLRTGILAVFLLFFPVGSDSKWTPNKTKAGSYPHCVCAPDSIEPPQYYCGHHIIASKSKDTKGCRPEGIYLCYDGPSTPSWFSFDCDEMKPERKCEFSEPNRLYNHTNATDCFDFRNKKHYRSRREDGHGTGSQMDSYSILEILITSTTLTIVINALSFQV